MPPITDTELRKVSGGFDPGAGNWVHRGLDLSTPTEITPAEIMIRSCVWSPDAKDFTPRQDRCFAR